MAWQVPMADLGLHRSADGITEYRSGAFGGALQGALLIAEFSGGDDVIAVRLAADGSYAVQRQATASRTWSGMSKLA